MNHVHAKQPIRKPVKQPVKKPVGILIFPGTLCDKDVKQAFKIAHQPVKDIWYSDRFSYKEYSGFVLPGGFSYGDYLRPGALATHASALQDLCLASSAGWPVLGICNGFQILCEAGLLEGTLRVNQHERFVDKWVELTQCSVCKPWGGLIKSPVYLPIAHKEGCFYATSDQLSRLHDEQRVWWQYRHNPNGSLKNIAGIIGKNKRTAGLMPHPERAVADWMTCTDGLVFFQNL